MSFTTFFKPMGRKLAKALTTRERQKRKAREARHAKLAAALESDSIRRQVFQRDMGLCRVCGRPVTFYGLTLTAGHAHHVIYRSAGGSDEATNRVLLCAWCHDDEHRHVIDISGDPNQVITITRRHPESGAVIERTESPCPR